MLTIFCPTCGSLMLDQATCTTCGWRRPLGAAGALAWRVELGRAPVRPCVPAVTAGRYCLGADDGAVVALDLRDGQVTWSYALAPGYVARALVSDGDLLFVGPSDNRPLPASGGAFVTLAAQSGVEVWTFAVPSHSCSAAALAADAVYFTSSDGRLYSLDAASGRLRWSAPHMHWGPDAPASSGGIVVAGGRGETLAAYDAASGAGLWRVTGAGWFASTPAISDGRVFAFCWDDRLYALDLRSGQVLWERRGERGRGLTAPPVAAGGLVLIGDRVAHRVGEAGAYALLALRAEDGVEAWRFTCARRVEVPPCVADGMVYLATDDGRVVALDLADGTEHWSTRLADRFVAQPCVSGDLLCLAGHDGACAAIHCGASPTATLLAPDNYLRAGQHEHAAIAYALRGEPARAAAIYEETLNQPREAALLYQQAGQTSRAAALWERLGDLRRAAVLYREAGDRVGLARILERFGEPLRAAQLYEQAGDLEAAARLYEQFGDRLRAAELYVQIGRDEPAQAIWESLDAWERLVRHLVSEGNPATAAHVLERHDQAERAAQLYEQAEQYEPALRLRLQLEHWEQVADLATRLGDDAQAALALDRLGRVLPAAEAYERAAQRVLGAHPPDEEQAAEWYERAAQLYESIYDERAIACRGQVRRYRRLPEVVVSGGAQCVFIENEWNTLQLRVENIGYGPARDVEVVLRGKFDVDHPRPIASLAPKRAELLELPVRPQMGHYGPKVPLEVSVIYLDTRGERSQVAKHIPVHVVPEGSTPGFVTPPQIHIQPELTHDPEEIAQQQELLGTHRRTLGVYLKRLATVGAANAPPEVINGISEARENILRRKRILRGWGVPVGDHPDDEG